MKLHRRACRRRPRRSIGNGYVDSDGALIGICGQPRVRVDLAGRVETLIGPRSAARRRATYLSAVGYRQAVGGIDTFYEHVGTTRRRPAATNNPWQMVADPQNEHMLHC